MRRQWNEAIATAKKALDRKPDHFPALLVMASVYGMSGQLEEGWAVAAKIMKTTPGYCVEKGWLPYKKRPMRKPYGIVSAKWGFQSALQNERVFQPIQIPLIYNRLEPFCGLYRLR